MRELSFSSFSGIKTQVMRSQGHNRDIKTALDKYKYSQDRGNSLNIREEDRKSEGRVRNGPVNVPPTFISFSDISSQIMSQNVGKRREIVAGRCIPSAWCLIEACGMRPAMNAKTMKYALANENPQAVPNVYALVGESTSRVSCPRRDSLKLQWKRSKWKSRLGGMHHARTSLLNYLRAYGRMGKHKKKSEELVKCKWTKKSENCQFKKIKKNPGKNGFPVFSSFIN